MENPGPEAGGVGHVLEAALSSVRAMGPAVAERIRSAFPFKRKAFAARPGVGPEALENADRLFEAVCGKKPLLDPEGRLLAAAALLYLIQPADAVPDAAVRAGVDDVRVLHQAVQSLGLVRKPKVSGALASLLEKARARPDSAPAVSAAPPPDLDALEAIANSFCTEEGRTWFLGEVRRSRAFKNDPTSVLRRLEVSLTSPSAAERHEAAADLRRLARADHAYLDRAARRWSAIVSHMQEAGDHAGLRGLREAFCETDPPEASAHLETDTPEKAAALLSQDSVRACAAYGRLRHAKGAAEAARAVLAHAPPPERLAAEADDLMAAAEVGGVGELRRRVEEACLIVLLGEEAAADVIDVPPGGEPKAPPERILHLVMSGGRHDPLAGGRGAGRFAVQGRMPSLDRAARERDRLRAERQALRPKVRKVAASLLQVRGYDEAAAILWAEEIAEEEGRRRLHAARDVAVAAGRSDLFEAYEAAIAFLSGPPGIRTPES